MSLDELAQLEHDLQEAAWLAYEQAPDDLKEMGWIKPPQGERLTAEQFKTRLLVQAASRRNFRIPDASYKSF